jgi:nicotinamidase-related amidase
MSEATALVIVDLQQAVFGGHGIPAAHEADRLLGNAALLQEARASGVPVVHIQHCGAAGEAFEEGAPGWAIAPRLRPAVNEPVVRKRASNAFEDTELRTVLQELGVRTLVITGPVGSLRRGDLSRSAGLRVRGPARGGWSQHVARRGPIGRTDHRGSE